MEQALRQLVEKVSKAHGEDLVSLILYGSAAEPSEHDAAFSDINILCVLREVTPRQMADGQAVALWWRESGNPAPLLMSEKEVARAADCFPIEFRDMKVRHRLLGGRDVIEAVHVDQTFYRAQVEYELRAKLLRLRQKAAGLLGDADLLARLLLDSVTTFCLLTRHALTLAGADPPSERRAVMNLAAERFGVDPAPFQRLLDAREKKIATKLLDPRSLLGNYLSQIDRIIDAVDGLEAPRVAGARGDA